LRGNRAGLPESKAANLAVVTLRQRRLVIIAESEIQRQPRRDFPIVMQKRRVVIEFVGRVDVIVDPAAGRIAQQQRSEFVARQCVALQRIGLRESLRETVGAADDAQADAVLFEALQIGADLENVVATHQVDVRLQAAGCRLYA